MRQYYYEQDAEDYIRQKHYKYVQYYDNILVENTLFFLHSDTSNLLLLAHGDIVPNLSLEVSPSVSEETALVSALSYVNATQYAWENSTLETNLQEAKEDETATYYPKGHLIIVAENNTYDPNDYHLAYQFEIYAIEPLQNILVSVDAQTGEVIKTQNQSSESIEYNDNGEHECDDNITSCEQTMACNPSCGDAVVSPYDGYQTFCGKYWGFPYYNYTLQNCNTGLQGWWGLGSNSAISKDGNGYYPANDSKKDAATAFWGIGRVGDYYQNTHNRNGMNNNGRIIFIKASFLDNPNAYFVRQPWNAEDIIQLYSDFPALDVLGHEFTHGVVRFCTNSNSSIPNSDNGAIEEGICDIFGQMAEKYHKGSTDWIAMSEVPSTANIAGARRNLSNPLATNGLAQPDTYVGTNWSTSTDNHHRDGVVNKWFYLIANGGTHNNKTITSLGVSKAEKILYRTVNYYFTQNQGFTDFRNATIQATRDLYGWCSADVREVSKAWEACGVGTTLYCATFGVSIKGALYCQEGSLTLYTSHNLPNTPTYSWGATTGVSISNQVANHATFSNLHMPSTTMNVTVTQSSPSISVSASRTVSVTSCRLSDPSLGNRNEVKVYPNPTQNTLNIETLYAGFEYTLVSYTGAKISEGKSEEKYVNIPVSSLSNGIYTLEIKTTNGVYHQKVEIMK